MCVILTFIDFLSSRAAWHWLESHADVMAAERWKEVYTALD